MIWDCGKELVRSRDRRYTTVFGRKGPGFSSQNGLFALFVVISAEARVCSNPFDSSLFRLHAPSGRRHGALPLSLLPLLLPQAILRHLEAFRAPWSRAQVLFAALFLSSPVHKSQIAHRVSCMFVSSIPSQNTECLAVKHPTPQYSNSTPVEVLT